MPNISIVGQNSCMKNTTVQLSSHWVALHALIEHARGHPDNVKNVLHMRSCEPVLHALQTLRAMACHGKVQGTVSVGR